MQMEHRSSTKGFFRLNESWCVLTVFASNSMELEFPVEEVIERTDSAVQLFSLTAQGRAKV